MQNLCGNPRSARHRDGSLYLPYTPQGVEGDRSMPVYLSGIGTLIPMGEHGLRRALLGQKPICGLRGFRCGREDGLFVVL